MGRIRSSKRAIGPLSTTRTRNIIKKTKNFKKPTNCERALVAIGSLANLNGSFYIKNDDMKDKVGNHAGRNNEVLGKRTGYQLDVALLKCRKLGLIVYKPGPDGGDSFKLTDLGKALFQQVKEALRDLEFPTNIEVHRATCEALRRLLPNGRVPTLIELDVENREALQKIDVYKARFGELSAEDFSVDSVVSNLNGEADEGVIPDEHAAGPSNVPSTPVRPPPSQNDMRGYPTPDSLPRLNARSLSVRYAMTQNADAMVVDEPAQGPANDSYDPDEKVDELNLKNRELAKELSSLAAEFSCVVRKYRMKEKETETLLQERDKEIQALKTTIRTEKRKLDVLLVIHRRLRWLSNVLQRRIEEKTTAIHKLEQDLNAANTSALTLNETLFQHALAA